MTVDFSEGEDKEAAVDAKSVASVSGSAHRKASSVKGSVAPIQQNPPAPTTSTKGNSRPTTPEPPKDNPQPPLTDSDKVKRELTGNPSASSRASARSASPTPTSAKQPSLILPSFEDTFDAPPRSNLPMHLRSDKGKGKGKGVGLFKSSVSALSGYLLGVDIDLEELERKQKSQSRRMRTTSTSGLGSATENIKARRRSSVREDSMWRDKDGEEIGVRLPRHVKVLRNSSVVSKKDSKNKLTDNHLAEHDYLKGVKKVVVIGVHGWFPGTLMRSVIGAVSAT
jgi:hypothetical protein